MASTALPLFFLVALVSSPATCRSPMMIDSFMGNLPTESGECEPTYGFMPCTNNALGNIFLVLVYGYLMYIAASFLSYGSELLLDILGSGIIGGLFLPILGALPDAMLILVSGLSGSKEAAQSQVSVGMGLLAGSTVMLLTLIWGSCVVVGKCDIHDSMAIDSQDTRGFSLSASGVTTDIWTSYAARIMAISVLPFIIVQAPQALHSNSGRHLAVLIALVVSILLLISYCIYQVLQPWMQRRRIAFVAHKHFISGFLKHIIKEHSLGRLLRDDGELDIDMIDKLFNRIDENSDGRLSASELRAFVIGIEFERMDFEKEKSVEKVMKDFDTSANGFIERGEFVRGISRWIEVARGHKALSRNAAHSLEYINNFHTATKQEHESLLVEGGEIEGDGREGEESSGKWTTVKAGLLLVLGTAVAAAFADPLVDAVDSFSTATHIPSFFVSFVALPLATNSSEALSAVIFSRRKTKRTASLTFSELCGAVTMNNVLCLSVFLGLVYTRGLVWDFSAEVLVILIVCLVMGLFASFRTTFRLWTSLLAFSLYPLSLFLVYLLDHVFGWS